MKKMMMILGPVLLLGGGAAFYFLVMAKPAGELATPTLGPPGMVSMDSFLVNIGGNEGDRFAKVDLRLTVVPSSSASRITNDELLMAKMRDRILTLLSAKSFDELSSPLGKEGFRRELKARLSPLVEDGEIQDVLFQDFMVQ